MFADDIRRILSQREQQTVIINYATLTPAAVLIPLYEKEANYYMLLTKRTQTLEHHRGQICFPGGAKNADDPNLRATALRETCEEIGVAPADVEILGELDRMSTLTSNFLVTPFVGVIPYPYEFKVNREEIEELVEVPLSALTDDTNYREQEYIVDGTAYTGSIFEHEGNVIWGATARMIRQFLDLVYRVDNQ